MKIQPQIKKLNKSRLRKGERIGFLGFLTLTNILNEHKSHRMTVVTFNTEENQRTILQKVNEVLAGQQKNKLTDKIISFISYLGISLPTFFLAFLLLYFATFGSWLPLGGMRSVNFDEFSLGGKIWDIARHLVIPAAVLSIGSICALGRILRANLLAPWG